MNTSEAAQCTLQRQRLAFETCNCFNAVETRFSSIVRFLESSRVRVTKFQINICTYLREKHIVSKQSQELEGFFF